MSADADAVCGAGYGQRAPIGVTPVTVTGAAVGTPAPGPLIWRSRSCGVGSYFPDWLLERRRRAESALMSVVATCYLLGVSTWRMEKLVEPLGITRLSRSQVSEMAKDLDGQVEAFRS